MELKTRSAAIIKEALLSNSGIPFEDFIVNFGITKRTLYNDIKDINEWLAHYNLGKIKTLQQELYLITTKKENLYKKLQYSDYYYSAYERQIVELLMITLAPELVNINKLQIFFGVSKNTISSDIRQLKEKLVESNIILLSTSKQGYHIQGEEYAIRKTISKYFNSLEQITPIEEVKKLIQESIVILTGKNFDFYEIARCLIKQYEIDINSQLYTGYIESECTMLLVSWIRVLKGNAFTVSLEEKDTLKITKSYLSLVTNNEKLSSQGLFLPENEVYYMTILLLGIRIVQFSSQEQENLFIYKFVEQLIENFEKISCTTISQKDLLAIKLRSHVRPLYYRMKYGLQENTGMSNQIMNMYPYEFNFCERSLRLSHSVLRNTITDDEIAYLTIYFLGSYTTIPTIRTNFETKKKVLVVCHKGRAESDYLIYQLQDLLGDLFFFETSSNVNINDSQIINYSLIVTTTLLNNLNEAHKDKVIYVPNKLSEVYGRVIKVLTQKGIANKDHYLIESILKDVENNLPNINYNKEKLYLDILKTILLGKNNELLPQVANPMSKIIKDRTYKLLKGMTSWESVLYEGYKGVYGHDLALKYLSNSDIHENQFESLYNVAPDTVIIYCKQNIYPDVYRISVVTSKQKLALTEDIQGNIFIFFASKNTNEHFPQLKIIYDYCDGLSNECRNYIIEGIEYIE